MPRRYFVTLFVLLVFPLIVTACGDGSPQAEGGSAPPTSVSLQAQSQGMAATPPPRTSQPTPAMLPTQAPAAAMMITPVPPGGKEPAQPALSDLSYQQTTIAPIDPANKAVVKRVVLKNAALNLTVEDPGRTVQQVTQMAEGMGGWVVASNTTTTVRDGRQLIQAVISVRVPASQFATALQQIKAQAVSIDAENITGDDVTNKFVDLTSQLSNLQSSQDQLQKIMSTANNINDVLTVENKLADVRGQIEQIKGQLQYFSEADAFSLINLTLIQKAPPPSPTPSPTLTMTPTNTLTPTATFTPTPRILGLTNWHPEQTVVNAADALITVAERAITLLIWLAIFGLPVVIPLAIIWLFVRRRVPKSWFAPPQSPPPPTGSAD